MECSVTDCAAPANVPGAARGLCRKHYRRWQRHGDTSVVQPRWASLPPLEERFWQRVEKTDSCWLWTGAKWQYGHGYIREKGKQLAAHRLAYMWLVGPLEEDMQVHHRCNNAGCVNPAHLELLTWHEHIDTFRMQNERKTHCKRGHPFDEENTYLHPSGKRQCRTCARMLNRRHYNKQKGGQQPPE